jgi:hypothetical protein
MGLKLGKLILSVFKGRKLMSWSGNVYVPTKRDQHVPLIQYCILMKVNGV